MTGKGTIFHIIGAIIVLFWLVMMSLLVSGHGLSRNQVTSIQKGNKLPIQRPEQEWMEIFLNTHKVGYSFTSIRPLDQGYMIREEIFMQLQVMGVPGSVRTVSNSVVDEKFIVKQFRFQVTSGVVCFDVSGKVRDGWLFIERKIKGKKRVQKLKLQSPPISSAAIPFILSTRKLKVGETMEVPIFDPSTMTQLHAVIRVVARESITIHATQYQAVRLETDFMGQQLTFWVSDEGELLKQTGLMGLTLIRSSPSRAMKGIGNGKEEELYDMVAITPRKKIRRPRKVSWLRVRIVGVDPKEIYTDQGDLRQSINKDVLTIKMENLPNPSTQWEDLSNKGKSDLNTFLKPEINIESDAAQIKAKAAKITAGTVNRVEMARRLLQWVYQNLEKRPVFGIPSALETLEKGVGDCNEHAALLTALLRASGIPARVCIGLVYTRGRFFYHAWTEAFLYGQWVTMDPTLNQMPADATHIKLAQGRLGKQVQIIRLMGRLGLEVIGEK